MFLAPGLWGLGQKYLKKEKEKIPKIKRRGTRNCYWIYQGCRTYLCQVPGGSVGMELCGLKCFCNIQPKLLLWYLCKNFDCKQSFWLQILTTIISVLKLCNLSIVIVESLQYFSTRMYLLVEDYQVKSTFFLPQGEKDILDKSQNISKGNWCSAPNRWACILANLSLELSKLSCSLIATVFFLILTSFFWSTSLHQGLLYNMHLSMYSTNVYWPSIRCQPQDTGEE